MQLKCRLMYSDNTPLSGRCNHQLSAKMLDFRGLCGAVACTATVALLVQLGSRTLTCRPISKFPNKRTSQRTFSPHSAPPRTASKLNSGTRQLLFFFLFASTFTRILLQLRRNLIAAALILTATFRLTFVLIRLNILVCISAICTSRPP